MKRKLINLFTVASLALLVLAAAPATGQITPPLGILDLDANDGINPATGNGWAMGDTYRFVFTTSGMTAATSTDIATYNTFVQNAANASSLNIGAAQGVTWKAIASTGDVIVDEVVVSEGVDARDNTSTNIAVNGTGEAIFLLNGTTMVAEDYPALWGNGSHSSNIDMTEELTAAPRPDGIPYGDTWTGTSRAAYDPEAETDYGIADPGFELGALDGESQCGLFAFYSGTHWIWRWTNDTNIELPLYALSEPLTLGPPGGFFDPNVNGDTMYDDLDMQIILSNFVAEGEGGGPEYNEDNLEVLLEVFGSTVPVPESTSTVPEPASMILLLFGALGLLGLRRRK